MKRLGNDVYIQRGETWSLDFEVTNEKGDPFMLLKTWEHPYLAITVTAARYEQKGDYRHTWWLDLDEKWVENVDGSMSLESTKKFISTEALNLPLFSVSEAIGLYGTDNGGRIVLDKNSDFDITNYLFFADLNSDGNNQYKYVKDYIVGPVYHLEYKIYDESISYNEEDIVLYADLLYYVKNTTSVGEVPGVSNNFVKMTGYDEFYNVSRIRDISGEVIYNDGDVFLNTVSFTPSICLAEAVWKNIYPLKSSTYTYLGESITSEEWEDYNFRIIKQFTTRDWVEQGYLFDMKILAGESVEEYVYRSLEQEGDNVPELPWDDTTLQEQINYISNEEERLNLQEIYDSGMPLMPTYDTKALILQPTKLFVSANIQGRF